MLAAFSILSADWCI